MRRADVMELLGHDVLGDFGFVAFAAQVREVKMAQAGGHDLRGSFGGGDVREMAVASENPLLQRPRAVRFLKQLHVVIGFEHKHVRGADAFDDEFGHVAEVGDETDVCRLCAQEKSDRVLRVVRNGKGFDEQIVQFKAVAGRKNPPVNFGFKRVRAVESVERGMISAAQFFFECPNGRVLRFAIAKNRNLKFVGDA